MDVTDGLNNPNSLLSKALKERLIKLYIETREEKLRLESELWKLENPDIEDLPEDNDFEEEEELL